jgi:hypothetical protein
MIAVTRRTLGLAALTLAVTAGGACIGALVVAPAIGNAPAPISLDDLRTVAGRSIEATTALAVDRIAAGAAVAGELAARLPAPVDRALLPAMAAMVLLAAAGWWWRQRRRGAATARPGVVPLVAVAGRAGRAGRTPDRTPKAVRALAAAGAAPAEIAWRTGLPHDAVAMLLSLAPRQVPPPAA